MDAVVSTHDLGDLIAAVLAAESGAAWPFAGGGFSLSAQVVWTSGRDRPIRCQPLLLDEPLPVLIYPAYLKAPWLKLGILGFKVDSDARNAGGDGAGDKIAGVVAAVLPVVRACDRPRNVSVGYDRHDAGRGVHRRTSVTVEGWSLGGDVQIWAMTDTNTFEGTRVIDNFSTPSRVDDETAGVLTEENDRNDSRLRL